jgi:hypothetical protein
MPRRSTFTVDASEVQGIEGAEVVFRALKVREFKEYRSTEMTDDDLLAQHLVSWSGFVDDNDKPLPSPADDPGVLGELYLHERSELARLLFQGPDGASAKN